MDTICPKCNHKFEVTFSRGEKDDFGYLTTSIGHRIAELAVKGKSKDQIMHQLYEEEVQAKAKSPSFHSGRVNRVFNEIKDSIPKKEKKEKEKA